MKFVSNTINRLKVKSANTNLWRSVWWLCPLTRMGPKLRSMWTMQHDMLQLLHEMQCKIVFQQRSHLLSVVSHLVTLWIVWMFGTVSWCMYFVLGSSFISTRKYVFISMFVNKYVIMKIPLSDKTYDKMLLFKS